MRRRRLFVACSLVLAGLGWAAAHALAHRAMMPKAADAHAPGLQGYLSYLPTSLALCLALALPLAAGAALGKRWRGASARSLWLFGVVPVLGFVGHALAEPLVTGSGSLAGTAAGAASLAPVVLVGLVIQVPFALAAVGLARRILALAESVARFLAGPARALGGFEPLRLAPVRESRAPAFRLDRAHSSRAPPSLPPL